MLLQIDKHLFTGDFIFKGTIGRFDFSNSDATLMKRSLNKILKWSEDFSYLSRSWEKQHFKK